MLYGDFITAVDDKGRAGMGQQFREHFGETARAYMTGDCLRVFVDSAFEREFAREKEKLESGPPSSAFGEDEGSARKRRLFGGIFDVAFDKQGRMTIPRSVRRDLALVDGSQVVWVGVEDYVELWPAERLYMRDEFEKELEQRRRRYLREQAVLHDAQLKARWEVPVSPDTEDAGCALPGREPEKPSPGQPFTHDPDGHGDGRK